MTLARLEIYLRLLFIALSIVSGIGYYIQNNIVRVVSALLTIALFMLPDLLARILRIRIPASFRLVFLVFIVVAMYVGELHNMFYRIPWWDDMVHTSTGMLVTYVAWILIYVLSGDRDIHTKLGPLFTALIVFSFTMAYSALWELFEYSVDRFLGLNLMKGRATADMNGVYDYGRALLNTMQDFTVDAIGAFLVALAAYTHLRRIGGTGKGFGILIGQFMRENPRFFTKS